MRRAGFSQSFGVAAWRLVQFWMPSCGGVDMRIEPNPEQFHDSQSPFLPELKRRVSQARPESTPVAWNVAPQDAAQFQEAKDRLDLQKLNPKGAPLIVKVVDQRRAYHASAPGFSYKGLDSESLIQELGKLAQQQGMAEDLVTARIAGLEVSLKRLQPDAQLLPLEGISGTTLEMISSPGTKLNGTPTATERVTTGPYQGFFRAVVSFWVSVKGKLYQVTLTVLGPSAALVDSFLERLHVSFALYDSSLWSILQLLDQTSRELRAHGLRFQIQDEAGRTHYVDLQKSQPEKAA